jgi:phage replication O-like protein O
MANPQAENGDVDIANDIMDHLAKTRIPGEARQVLDFVLRKTYGWHKKCDWVSLSQFVEGTGLKKPNVIRAMATLLRMNLVIQKDNVIRNDNDSVIQSDNRFLKLYEFQKDFDKWQPLPRQRQRGKALSNTITTVIQNDKRSLSETIPTKENYTKETLTKEIKIFGQDPDKILTDPQFETFQRFWAAYPKRAAKKDAKKAWAKLNPQYHLVQIILSKIEEFKKMEAWMKEKGKYIPHPATFLNGKRWEDELQAEELEEPDPYESLPRATQEREKRERKRNEKKDGTLFPPITNFNPEDSG